MKTFMFPGQGSQAKGMGRELFDDYRSLTDEANALLGFSVEELCLDDPRSELDQTQFTQPALYVVNALSFLKRVEETGERPAFVVGHSLGEFNALFAAGCYSFGTGLRLVKKRGELMSQARGGGMAAILNASKRDIQAVLEEHGLRNVELANFNTPSQIVISGLKEEIVRAEACFKQRGLRYYPLRTSGAFHSSLMKPSREQFESYLRSVEFGELRIPVIANVTAQPYEHKEIALNLSRQITGPVRWVDSIRYLLEIGGRVGVEMEFEEIGPGNVLTGLANKIVSAHAEEAHRAAKVDATEARRGMPGEVPVQIERTHAESRVRSADPEQRARAWNTNHAIGTRVRCLNPEYDELETRTEAVVLFGHRAAVYLKGYQGYFDLSEVEPL